MRQLIIMDEHNYDESLDEQIEETSYTDNEKRYDFVPCWISLDCAIKTNQEVVEEKEILTWNQREYAVLKMIQEELNQG